MAKISLNVGCVIALYDVCTEFSVRVQQIQIESDLRQEPIYKGNGVFVFMGNLEGNFHIQVIAKGYVPQSVELHIGKDKRIPQFLIWLVPLITPQQRSLNQYLSMEVEEPGKYLVFIKSREGLMHLSTDCNAGMNSIVLYQRLNLNYENRAILLEDGGHSKVVWLSERIDEVTHEYKIDIELEEVYHAESTKVYKGYQVMVGQDKRIELPLLYTRKDSDDVKVVNCTEVDSI